MTLLWLPLLSATVPVDPATGDFDWRAVPLPVWASPKMDGFRAMVQRATLVGRNGLPIRNKELQARYGRKEYEGLDAELTDGPANRPGVFNRTSKIVTAFDADAANVRMNVIDYKGNDGMKLSYRIGWLAAKFGNAPPHLFLIPQVPIETLAQLKAYFAKCMAQGYEGVMLRRMDQGAYPQKADRAGRPLKQNRSTLREFYLARLKPFEFGEAVIIAVHPLRHNGNEERTGRGARSTKKAGIMVDASKVGSATLLDVKTGVEFDTTVGSEALRLWPGWKDERRWKGTHVRYRYQVCGTVDKPRINTCSFDELGVE